MKNANTELPIDTTSFTMTAKITNAIKNGMCVTLATSPFFNALNCLSVVCGRTNTGLIGSFKYIYKGTDSNPYSFFNFMRGLKHHCIKESTRQVYRAPGHLVLRPYLEEHIGNPATAAFLWTISMTAVDSAFHFLDTMRVLTQAGDPIVVSKLYAGAVPSALKHVTQYYLYAYLNNKFKLRIQNQGIDPHSVTSAVIQAVPLSICLTAVLFPMERIKNEKQFLRQDGSNYWKLAVNLVKRQGLIGLYRGYTPKVISSSVQTFFSLYLYNEAKHQLDARYTVSVGKKM